ncbi:hypothetical protein PV11_01530 [Exophiala sideris]|uniref:Methyltransferase domain-containing protein n=1 Tax=Exophiala sideris TaxID=1016849 RepID=A0A0D1ZGG0_9EURO|nr:hypothetical protein PV11_01530 [Exophiala sideris]
METETPAVLLNSAPPHDVQDDRTALETGDPGTSSTDKEKGSITEVSWRAWFPTRLWTEYVCPEMPRGAGRDHHSNEQTFIAWFSVAESMSVLGVAVTQISRIEALLDSELEKGGLYRILSVSLGCVCQVLAIVILLVGAYRFFETQHGLVNPGRLRFSPWGIYLVAVLILLFLVSLFVSQVAFDLWGFSSALNSATSSPILVTRGTIKSLSHIRAKRHKMSTNPHKPKEEQWTAEKYAAAASFVPQLTHKLVQYIDPQSTDRILDVGCGDGKFTSNFIRHVASAYGIDASSSFIESARTNYGSRTAVFKVVDCRYLENDAEVMNGKWDKVVSNAALQYILRDPTTRINTLKACFDSLRPGGQFIFEMGGAGNVSEAAAAMTSALYHAGLSIDQARDASPWFFPSQTWMEKTLTTLGFQVEKLEVEYRPTKLDNGPGGGLEGWIKLICGSMLQAVAVEKEASVVREACEVLRDVITREDGSQWLGFVRLRGVARKPQ